MKRISLPGVSLSIGLLVGCVLSASAGSPIDWDSQDPVRTALQTGLNEGPQPPSIQSENVAFNWPTWLGGKDLSNPNVLLAEIEKTVNDTIAYWDTAQTILSNVRRGRDYAAFLNKWEQTAESLEKIIELSARLPKPEALDKEQRQRASQLFKKVSSNLDAVDGIDGIRRMSVSLYERTKKTGMRYNSALENLKRTSDALNKSAQD